MTTYVALLRGIMPMNPNMRNEKLKGVFESLGLKNVSTVIGSGNVVFSSASKNTRALEARIEKALPAQLGFKSTTIIRSKEELEHLEKMETFGAMINDPKKYLIVTFLKNQSSDLPTTPHTGNGFTIVGTYDREIFSAIHIGETKSPDVMRLLEKKYGKEITTRTWKTVERILKKMKSE